MATTSVPLARGQPKLVASQPFNGPRNSAISNEVLHRPLGRQGKWIVEAEWREFGLVKIPVEMFGPIPRLRVSLH